MSIHTPPSPDSNDTLNSLMNASTPFLQINGIGTLMWRRHMKAGDPRIGPWAASIYEVLDEGTWRRNGECLYFLTDKNGRLRYVGESKNRLRDRWRTPPAVCALTGRDLGNAFVFHNRAWPPLERALKEDGGLAPFRVSVIHADALQSVVMSLPALARLKPEVREGKHLARLVQDWVCMESSLQRDIWNVAGKYSGKH